MVSWIASAELQGDGQASLLSLMDLKCSLGEVLTADSPVSAAAEDAGGIHLKPYYPVSCLEHLLTLVQWETCENVCWSWRVITRGSPINLHQSPSCPGAPCTQTTALGAMDVT